MLYTRIKGFVTQNCIEKDTKALRLAIFRYSLRLSSSKELIKTVKIEYGVGAEMQIFKKEFLDSSAYVLSRYWRAIYLCVRSRDCHFCDGKLQCADFDTTACEFKPSVTRIASALEVDVADIKETLSLLTLEDIIKIKEKPAEREWPCDADLKNMLVGLKPYAQYLKYKYLSFVERYYPEWGTETGDSPLVNDLLAEGYRIALKYDYKLELGNIKTICLSWMHNYAINLIKKCNAKSRQNIVRTHRRLSRSHGLEQDYTANMLSLDMTYGDSSSTQLNDNSLYGVIEAEDYHVKSEDKRFVRQLKSHSHSKKCQRFIDIVIGKRDDAFEAWLSNKGLLYDKLPPEKIGKLAMEHLELSHNRLKNRVGNFLKQELDGGYQCNNY